MLEKRKKLIILIIIFMGLIYATFKEIKTNKINQPNAPELISGMVPVTYQKDNWDVQ